MTFFTPKIDLLPEHLIDQIKAGEVVERPGNLIKEILENALDAGANKIELNLKNNGLDLISLKDNGHGMRFEDLPLAFSRHATSKISRFEDLYQLDTFGFRGEALASIASISKLQCLSKIEKEELGSEIRIEGGSIILHEKRQVGSFEHGTELVIKDLFYNTPARLKFIQSQQAEKNFIKKIFFSFVLTNFQTEFQLKNDDSDKEIYYPRPKLIERIKDLFPKAMDAILNLQRSYDGIEMELFLIPGNFKGPIKIQNVHINNRYVLDKQIHRVLTTGLTSVFGHDDFHYIASFHLPPDRIDVNVHPSKTLIKVLEISKLMGMISSSIKSLTDKNEIKNPSEIPSFDKNLTPNYKDNSYNYNLDGIFSPHQKFLPSEDPLLWVDEFLIKKLGTQWIAIHAGRLLERYIGDKLLEPSLSIPLLVSEPFSAKELSKERIDFLNQSGMELESLGNETIVVRAIPDWMNGFPLRIILPELLKEKSIKIFKLSPDDWPQSVWTTVISHFKLEKLLEEKIVFSLPLILKEKFK